MTRDEALSLGYTTFEAALGSTTTEPNVEAGWKDLFENKVGWELTWVNGHVAYLQDLCTWMGAYALTVPRGTGAITLREVLKAFKAVQEYAYHQNGDQPTKIC